MLSKKEPFFDNSAIELLTTEDLANRLKVSPKTIRNWRYLKQIPNDAVVQIGKKAIRYNWVQITRWLQQRSNQ